MKNKLFLTFLLSLSFLMQGSAVEFFEIKQGEAPDHLTPISFPPNIYYQEVEERLWLTSGRFGGFMSFPSFDAESGLFIHKEDSKYYITVTRASKNIGQAIITDSLSEITVTRSQRQISRELAARIQRVWGNMILNTKYPLVSSRGLDGSTYHFYIWLKGLGYIEGQTWSPQKGILAELVSVAQTLEKFAVSDCGNEKELIDQLKLLEERILTQKVETSMKKQNQPSEVLCQRKN